MSKGESSPTMIIPSGTEIQIDVHGQLSVRTPGNLVIQNSGHYGEIESVHGSIRIESNAEVEAVSVKCAETCYVQGSLTSWKVKAKSINLEEQAQARVVLQETDAVEIGKNAKLVGNFASEKELFLLFSRFTQQLRSLPFYFDRGSAPEPGQLTTGVGGEVPTPPVVEAGMPSVPGVIPTAPAAPPVSAPAPGMAAGAPAAPQRFEVSNLPDRIIEAGEELPDQLFFALVLLEREGRNEAYGATSLRVVEELVKLLRNREFETLQHTRSTLFQRIVEPGDDIQRARELIDGYFSELESESAEA